MVAHGDHVFQQLANGCSFSFDAESCPGENGQFRRRVTADCDQPGT
jgi:hypothetical protein